MDFELPAIRLKFSKLWLGLGPLDGMLSFQAICSLLVFVVVLLVLEIFLCLHLRKVHFGSPSLNAIVSGITYRLLKAVEWCSYAATLRTGNLPRGWGPAWGC